MTPQNNTTGSRAKFPIFSLVGIGLNIYMSYLFFSLWISPRVSDAEMILNLSVLMFFEFVLVHSGVFMTVLGRSWKSWLGFISVYGLFALAFNTIVSGNLIIIIYGAVVLNRVLSGIFETDKDQEILMSCCYAVIYFFLMFAMVLLSSHIPEFGLNAEFLAASKYNQMRRAAGINVETHAMMCFGAVYYMSLTLIDVLFLKRDLKKA